MTPDYRPVFLLPYFGAWPVWFPLFLESCSTNPSFAWKIYGDHNYEGKWPENVHFQNLKLSDFHALSEKKLDLKIALKESYKICDLKPMYGHIFEDDIGGYTHWGITDLDLAYGDLASFVNDDALAISTADVWSAYDKSCGAFQFFRNSDKLRYLYQKIPGYAECLAHEKMISLTEPGLDYVLKRSKGLRWLKVVDYESELNRSRPRMGAWIMKFGEIERDQCLGSEVYEWSNGQTFQLLPNNMRKEFMFLHWFQWKQSSFWKNYDGSSGLRQWYLSYEGFGRVAPLKEGTKQVSVLMRYKAGWHDFFYTKFRPFVFQTWLSFHWFFRWFPLPKTFTSKMDRNAGALSLRKRFGGRTW